MKFDFGGKPGEYGYSQDKNGSRARGVVRLGPTSERNPEAQRKAGGESRKADDQGGHGIAHRFGGANEGFNLHPQAKDVNQRDQASVERDVAKAAEDEHNKVVLDVANFTSVSERPDATMITVAVKNEETGQTEVVHTSFQNEQHELQEAWNKDAMQDDEIDPRQDVGMTPEQRELANAACHEEDQVDMRLGHGAVNVEFGEEKAAEDPAAHPEEKTSETSGSEEQDAPIDLAALAREAEQTENPTAGAGETPEREGEEKFSLDIAGQMRAAYEANEQAEQEAAGGFESAGEQEITGGFENVGEQGNIGGFESLGEQESAGGLDSIGSLGDSGETGNTGDMQGDGGSTGGSLDDGGDPSGSDGGDDQGGGGNDGGDDDSDAD
ncbi:MAG: DNA/RNA non-specific endonuclease [Lachnospiraceae bacterium]|nr:DNA/RNA non-specific endonuclease [Lachnospiraceae bacterium]